MVMPSGPPVPITPHGMDAGSYCRSGRRRDSERAACKPWCRLEQQCAWCKCRACANCQHLPPLRPTVPAWYNATYRRPCHGRTRCAEKRVWAVQLPCESRALPGLPRKLGCWLLKPDNCRRSEESGLRPEQGWSLQHAATSTSACLVTLPSSASRACFTPHQLRAWHSVQTVLVTARGGARAATAATAAVAGVAAASAAAGVAAGMAAATAASGATAGGAAAAGCTLVQQALPWQVPKRGLCFSAGAQPEGLRYVTNHAHQAELFVPIRVARVVTARACGRRPMRLLLRLC